MIITGKKCPCTFWKNGNLLNINYFAWCILKYILFNFGNVAVIKISGLIILIFWFIMWDTLIFMHLYVDIYSVTLNQIFSPRVEGNFKSSILQFPLNYACNLPQSSFKISPQFCTLPVAGVSSRTDGGTSHSDRRSAVFLYVIFIIYLQKMLSNEVRQHMAIFL